MPQTTNPNKAPQTLESLAADLTRAFPSHTIRLASLNDTRFSIVLDDVELLGSYEIGDGFNFRAAWNEIKSALDAEPKLFRKKPQHADAQPGEGTQAGSSNLFRTRPIRTTPLDNVEAIFAVRRCLDLPLHSMPQSLANAVQLPLAAVQLIGTPSSPGVRFRQPGRPDITVMFKDAKDYPIDSAAVAAAVQATTAPNPQEIANQVSTVLGIPKERVRIKGTPQHYAVYILGESGEVTAEAEFMTGAMEEVAGSTGISQAVQVLNEAFECDPEAILGLIRTRIPCNDDLADHPTIQVALEPYLRSMHATTVGFLGVLNGILETMTGHKVAAVFDQQQQFRGFDVHRS